MAAVIRRAVGQLVVLGIAAMLGAAVAAHWAGDRARAAWRRQWVARLAEQAESTAAWRDRMAAAQRALTRFREDSSRLYPALAAARRAAAADRAALRQLGAEARLTGDTLLPAALEQAIGAQEREAEACRAVVTNCEARAALQAGLAADATRQLTALAALQDTTVRRLAAAERRASSGVLGWRALWRAKEEISVLLLVVLLLRQ